MDFNESIEHKPKTIVSDKSRAVSAILAFTFGWLGLHRFYVGKKYTGALMIVLSLSVVLFWFSLLWSFVDFIFIVLGSFTDKDKRKIINWSD